MSAVCLLACKDWTKATHTIRNLDHVQRRKGPYNVEKLLAQNPFMYLSEEDRKKKVKAYRTVKECEDFFDSPMFTEMTGLSGKDEAIKKLRFMNQRKRDALKRSEKLRE